MIHLRGRTRKSKPPEPPRRCKECGKIIDRKNTQYCTVCGEIKRKERISANIKYCDEKAKAIRKYRLEHRLCTYCGTALQQGETHRECPDCRSYRADVQQARYQRLIDNRQCARCREKLPDGYYHVYCEDCREKEKARKKEAV